MAKIVITNYDYMEHPIGSVVDLGDIKNNSLVGMGRAVWYESPAKSKTKSKPVTSEAPAPEAPKKILQNQLQEQVVEEKKKSSSKASFWDKLK